MKRGEGQCSCPFEFVEVQYLYSWGQVNIRPDIAPVKKLERKKTYEPEVVQFLIIWSRRSWPYIYIECETSVLRYDTITLHSTGSNSWVSIRCPKNVSQNSPAISCLYLYGFYLVSDYATSSIEVTHIDVEVKEILVVVAVTNEMLPSWDCFLLFARPGVP